MAMTWRKFKVYSKLGGIAILFLLFAVFLLQNSDKVSIKFLFWCTPQVPTFLFGFSAASIGVLVFKVSTKIGKVIREAKQLRREQAAKNKMVEQVRQEVETQNNQK